MIATTQSHFASPKLSLVAVVATTTLSLLNALGFPTQVFCEAFPLTGSGHKYLVYPFISFPPHSLNHAELDKEVATR